MCIGVLSPNNLYDRDQSDNLACDTVHVVLGIQDLPSDGAGVMVTNPFADALDIAFIAPAQESLLATLSTRPVGDWPSRLSLREAPVSIGNCPA